MGDAPIPSAVVDEMISFIRDTATARYSMLASTVLYVYDLVTTLDKEVDLVWTRPRSFLQVLFLINRYVTMFECLFNSSGKSNLLTMSSQRQLNCLISIPVPGHQSNEFGKRKLAQIRDRRGDRHSYCSAGLVDFPQVQIVFFDGGNISSVILVIRLWAMYGRNRWILISITAFWALQLVAGIIIIGNSVNYAPAIAQPAPGFVVCSTTLPPYSAACWIPVLAFEITLLALMLVKGWQNFRRENVTAVSGMTGKSLANLTVRDSMTYFVIINAAYVATAAVWYRKPPALMEAMTSWIIVLPPLMASKLLLNLRDAFYRGGRPHEDRSIELTTFRALERRPEASHSAAWTQTAASHTQSQWDEWGQGNLAES
ncbi:hypothetical protein BJ138DRAFT_672799 [Hygrophoropsis aurantiaca]|uniref:Uncharacterized protein n=1 Tax=Hygrophoropsis aurantiaca TaxID=72124 RepID=A0ACB7ZYY5_9AGAM|nr:hypothetical protein BJ138DRAFT_672799 [Hygrophoropsis aurantiaca]